MSDKYIAYFDIEGFEYIANIAAMESDCVMATLRNEEYHLPFNLEHLKLRARFNPQRFPEIWFFNVDPEISEETVRELASENPQYLADFIRANGKNVYGQPAEAELKRQRIV